ncbi:hypothetical protein ALC53_07066, partial [Atta colombica]
ICVCSRSRESLRSRVNLSTIFLTNMLQEFILSHEIQQYLYRLYRLTEERRIAVDESDEEERRWMGGRVAATHQREGEEANRGRRGRNFARARLYPPWLPPPSPPPPPPPLDAEGSWTARVSSTTNCCETELTRARKTTRSSLARDTLQLATTIMLAGIFEGNNVREKSFAIGNSIACILHFFANVHAEYIASRRRPRYFFIKRDFDSNRNAQMVCANVAWNYATRVLLLVPGFAKPGADSSHVQQQRHFEIQYPSLKPYIELGRNCTDNERAF